MEKTKTFFNKVFMKIKTFLQQTYVTIKNTDKKQLKIKFKRFFVGMKFTDGLIYKVVIYTLLISFAYIYLYPVFYMITNSLMTVDDIINVAVKWVPTKLNWENYRIIFSSSDFNYFGILKNALILAFVPAASATVSSAIIGYGFAKFNFPLKKILFVLMLMTFIIPPQITMIPTFRMFSRYNLLGSLNAFFIPAIMGQGLNGAIYILIFYQFFRMIPKSLEESAEIDGASRLKIFLKIAIPLAVPAIIIVFLFSFVWYYNETYLSGLFLGDSGFTTMPLAISTYINSFGGFESDPRAMMLYQAIRLAGNVLTILPLLILYFFTQRYFVESIDRTGITGE